MRVKSDRRPKASGSSARLAQRRRTRNAIVEAAMSLLARGGTPSISDVASAADVSRRTVYLYFPSFDHLLLDATVGVLTQAQVDLAIGEPAGADDVDGRVERLVRALNDVTPEVERLGRELIRLTVSNEPASSDGGRPRRGYRRIEWIEAALAPWRQRLGAKRWDRLVQALAMIVGWEALIVQRDVCGLTASGGAELSVWAARALMQAALTEAGPTKATNARRPRGPGQRGSL